jgi:hypothetical protein
MKSFIVMFSFSTQICDVLVQLVGFRGLWMGAKLPLQLSTSILRLFTFYSEISSRLWRPSKGRSVPSFNVPNKGKEGEINLNISPMLYRDFEK